MKKIYLLLGAAFLSAACSKEFSEPNAGLCQRSEEFSIGVDAAFKSTFVHGSGNPIAWSVGDVIGIYDGTALRRFTTAESGPSARFSGPVAEGATDFTAVYPFCASTVVSGSEITTRFPSEHWAMANTITDNSNISVGKASGRSIYMRNVGGYVCLRLPENDLDIFSIRLVANGGEALAGMVRISYDGTSDPVVSEVVEGVSELSLTTVSGMLGGGEYFFVANPVTMASGFTLKLDRADGTVATLRSDKSNTIRRNKTLDLGTIDLSSLEWKNTGEYLALDLKYKKEGHFLDQDESAMTWPYSPQRQSGTSTRDTNKVLTAAGYDYYLNGSGYLNSKGGYLFFTGGAVGEPYFRTPEIPGYKLVLQTHWFGAAYTSFVAKNAGGECLSYSEVPVKTAAAAIVPSGVVGAVEGEGVRLCYNTSTRATRLQFLYRTSSPVTPREPIEIVLDFYNNDYGLPAVATTGETEFSAGGYKFKVGASCPDAANNVSYKYGVSSGQGRITFTKNGSPAQKYCYLVLPGPFDGYRLTRVELESTSNQKVWSVSASLGDSASFDSYTLYTAEGKYAEGMKGKALLEFSENSATSQYVLRTGSISTTIQLGYVKLTYKAAK